MKNICVFCSSSNALPEEYYKLAQRFGKELASRNYNLVYGGANVGLMQTIAKEVYNGGCNVTGVLPKSFAERGLASEYVSSIHIVEDMHQRKKKLISLSDAFIALPGGFGTLDELLEVLTLKQIAEHSKPIVIFNYKGFFSNLLKQFDIFFEKNFAKPVIKNSYKVVDNCNDLFQYFEKYEEKTADEKWFEVDKEHFKK